jgi:hypothetical protein
MPDQPHDPSDQPTDPGDSGDRPGDDSRDPVERPSEPAPFAEGLRAKLDELGVDRHLEDFAAQLEQAVRQGVETIGALAHEHRDDIGGFLSRTAEALDRRTDGRHAETISQVRGQLERGVELIAEQRPDAGPADQVDPDEPSDPSDPSGKD